jgi:Protein  of unknown function (DUF3018)
MNDFSPKRQDKFKAYRARKKAAGLREVRLWLPDVRSKTFQEQAERSAAALRGHPSEEDSMAFIEALHAEDPGMWD